MNEQEARDRLRAHVRARHESVAAYVERMGPRGERLANISVIATGLAAVFTAGPALGGARFSDAVQRAFALQTDDGVYQVLCLVALLGAVVAAITVNLVKRQQTGTRVGIAQSVAGELEILDTALEFNTVSIGDAVKQYQHCLQKISFVPEPEDVATHGPLPPAPSPRPAPPPRTPMVPGSPTPPPRYPPRPAAPSPRPARRPAGDAPRASSGDDAPAPSETVVMNRASESRPSPDDTPGA